MKTHLFLTLLPLLVISCADNPKEQKNNTEEEQELVAETPAASTTSTHIETAAYPKHGSLSGSNIILRADPSTQSDKLDVLKGNGEKVKILEKLTVGDASQAITKTEVKTTIGKENITIPKGKAVTIKARNEESQMATISFRDIKSVEQTTDLNYDKLEFMSDSDWYQVETQKAKIGWVFGKFISEGAKYNSSLESKRRILTYSTPEDEEEYAEQGGEDWGYFNYLVEEYFKKKHPAVEVGTFFESDLSTAERKRLEKKLDLEGFGYVLIDGEKSHFLVHDMYDGIIKDAVAFFGF